MPHYILFLNVGLSVAILSRVFKSHNSSELKHIRSIFLELRLFEPVKIYRLLEQYKDKLATLTILKKLKLKCDLGENISFICSRGLQIALALETHMSKTQNIKKALFLRHILMLTLLLLAYIFLHSLTQDPLDSQQKEGAISMTWVFLPGAAVAQILSARLMTLMLPHSWLGNEELSPWSLSWIFIDLEFDAEKGIQMPWQKDLEHLTNLEIKEGSTLHQEKCLLLKMWHEVLEHEYSKKLDAFSEKLPVIELITFILLGSLWLGMPIIKLMASLTDG